MDEKKAALARKYGRTLEELKRVAQKQGWAVVPLQDPDGSSLGIFAIGRLDSVAALQELLKEIANAEG
jgi:hypothetical protein